MDCSLPGSSARGILQARILEWIAISFSSSSVWPLGYDQHQQEGAPRERLLLAMRKDSPKLKLWTSAAYIVTWEVVAEVQVQHLRPEPRRMDWDRELSVEMVLGWAQA